jgi:hypothetical protein
MYQVLDASIGHSLSLHDLASGYDYTVLSDFINTHGGSFTPLLGQIRWLLLIYLVFGSFISAGILYLISRESKDYVDFFKGGAYYFTNFFILDILFAFVIIAIGMVGLTLIGYLFGIAPTSFDNELPFLRYSGFIAFAITLIFIVLIVLKIFIKIGYLEGDQSLVKSVKIGFRSFWNHKWMSLFYSILFLIVSVSLVLWSHKIGNWPLLVMIVLQQLIITFKIVWRITFYRLLADFETNT